MNIIKLNLLVLEAKTNGTNLTIKLPNGFRKEVAGTGFPRGELLTDIHEGFKVYSFKPEALEKWLKRNDLLMFANHDEKNNDHARSD